MIEIRRLHTIAEFTEAVELQQDIWGFADRELLPVRLFVVGNKIGGHLFGAFDGNRMVAFLVAIPGIKEGARGYLHSHMMGVLPAYQNRGIGRLLKAEQRRDALSRFINLIEWTFDPLELKNAFFNIERLGAVVRRYVLNQYGTTSSHLHGGLPTDRCVAEWYISSPRVELALQGRVPPPRHETLARIPVPADIADVRQFDARRAREIQLAVSEQFMLHFEKGLAVIGFERSPTAGTYLLGTWESK